MTTYSLRIIALFYKVLLSLCMSSARLKSTINKHILKVRKVIDIIT